MPENKKEFRKQQIKFLTDFSRTKEAQLESESLYEKLFDSQEFKNANSISVTVSMGFELDTKPIIERAISLNKQVYIPKTDNLTKSMTFVRFIGYDELIKTEFGVLEPGNENDTLNPSDLIIVPGLAYTDDGYRLGFGAGFYDRYLAKYRPRTISLANSKQVNLSKQWQIDKFDIPVNKIITAK
ncbi:5-formyltetrahydrofolate cyclo-ligase [Companilactobacillus sp. RD055328]|uniref:5-formyltetrahydrofolate cyclo-ligase n=1 Tax=Companilactobacillus sp. RD055328 TaxID=2916634 RepID=UPI001FC8DE35|nr:5-formyltetrahydrofolate cyclo-ligase [Companilactobacillus sp. RD055328]GKQ42535.1 5-formyltetrahydrofolate cyclo-ligase [Companilactobacillus sp. RD055328]